MGQRLAPVSVVSPSTATPQGRLRRWLPLAVGSAFTLLTLFTWHSLSLYQRRQLEAALDRDLVAANEAISRGLEARIERLRRMARRWEEFGMPSRRAWNFNAALIYSAPSFQAIEWVDSSNRVRWVVPEEGNKKLVGLDLTFEERRRRALEEARRERRLVITEPIELVAGGRGFRVILPLFRQENFEGYITGVFRSQELMGELLADVAPKMLLTVHDGEMEVFRRPGPMGGEEERWTRYGSVRGYGADWSVRVWPTPALLVTYLTPMPQLLLGSGLLLSFLLALSTRLTLVARRHALDVERANVTLQREIEQRIGVEETLRANEERYRLISELTSDFSYAYTLNPDGSTVLGWITDAYTRITGLTVGRYSIIHPDDRHFISERNRRLLAGEPDRREYRIYDRAGEIRWLRDLARPIRLDPAHGSVFVVGAAQDITESKRYESRLVLFGEEQAAVAALGKTALETPELDRLFQTAVVTVAQTLAVPYCKVLRLEPDGKALRLIAGVGWSPGAVGQALVGTGTESQAGFTLQVNECVVVEDLRAETRFHGPPLLLEHAVVSGMSCVIPGRERPFGVLGAHCQERRKFTADEINFLQSVAHVLAAAVQRHATEEVLRQLSGHLLRFQDEERRRLARDLHDTTIQELAAISLLLANVEERISPQDERTRKGVSKAISLAQQCARGLRTMSYLLHPPLLDEAGLASALRDYGEGFSRRSGIAVEIEISDSFDRLPREHELALFRVAQESLTNVHRHSGSPRARIRVTRNTDHVILQIADEGHGGAAQPGSGPSGERIRLGVGLRGMRERLRQLEGELQIRSDSRGTTVTAKLPLRTQ